VGAAVGAAEGDTDGAFERTTDGDVVPVGPEHAASAIVTSIASAHIEGFGLTAVMMAKDRRASTDTFGA
jgi:hypothetical protein